MVLIDNYGYQANWLFMGILGVFGSLIGIYVLHLVEQEKLNVKNS
jgi:hypothetical protein